MATFRRGRAAADPPAPDSLEELRGATAQLERAKVTRDRAIARARQDHLIREVAEAAGLSVSRVKQLGYTGEIGADRTPVTDVDLWHLSPSDRVMALTEADPFVKKFTSERAFLQEDAARWNGRRSDISFKLYDLDPTESWTAVYIYETLEVYAFKNIVADESSVDDNEQNGSLKGPCYLLGHVPSYGIVATAIHGPALVISDRPGGLAWLYGRIRLINNLVKATFEPIGGFSSREDAWAYLSKLPLHERPNP